jgi:hypothetical protein
MYLISTGKKSEILLLIRTLLMMATQIYYQGLPVLGSKTILPVRLNEGCRP